jgi:hypothetical protein
MAGLLLFSVSKARVHALAGITHSADPRVNALADCAHYIPSIARARSAMLMATRVSGSSSDRPVSDWMRSTR